MKVIKNKKLFKINFENFKKEKRKMKHKCLRVKIVCERTIGGKWAGPDRADPDPSGH